MIPSAAGPAKRNMTEEQVKAKVKKAADDRTPLDGMRKSFKTIADRQRENAPRIPDLEARKERLRKTKEESVGNETLFKQAVGTLRENGFRVILAKTADGALRTIKEELRGYELAVKSKSNVTKELHLADELKKSGVEIIETDLGDRIIQLAGCQAAHPTGPACHLTRRQISRLFSDHFGRPVSEDPLELTAVMRDEIAAYMSKAKVGITGANAVTAREGAVVIVHNEGNAARCSMLPDKHIIVTTPDKVVPTLDDAVNVTKLQTYLSTGKIVSSYINVITGPSYTADIEKQVYKGMHGPKQVVIVFVDDGRMDSQDKEAQFCIGCGMCLLHCPVYSVLGPDYGPPGHMGGHGVYLAGSRGRTEESLDTGLYLCTSCGGCVEVCPSKVGTKKGIIEIRSRVRKEKKDTSPERAAVVASVRNYDNPWQVPRKQKGKWAEDLGLESEGETLFFAGCSTSLLQPETAKQAVRLIRACGEEPSYIGAREGCCGSTLRKLGEENLARQKAEACFESFKKAGAKIVVTSCPGCSSALNHYPDLPKKYKVKVQHISEFLDGRLDKSALKRVDGLGKVTYHDPCDLGREQGVYEPPRNLISAVLGHAPEEMERTRAASACCGSGSGVKSAYPELSREIGRDRIEMAKDIGAKTVVTACPWCVQNLRDCQGGRASIAVIDLVELLDMSHAAADQRENRRR